MIELRLHRPVLMLVVILVFFLQSLEALAGCEDPDDKGSGLTTTSRYEYPSNWSLPTITCGQDLEDLFEVPTSGVSCHQFTAEGACPPFSWNVTGKGVTVGMDGTLCIDPTGCGSFTITVTDACQNTVSISARLSVGEYSGIHVQRIVACPDISVCKMWDANNYFCRVVTNTSPILRLTRTFVPNVRTLAAMVVSKGLAMRISCVLLQLE